VEPIKTVTDIWLYTTLPLDMSYIVVYLDYFADFPYLSY